jgi:hypothetical protein
MTGQTIPLLVKMLFIIIQMETKALLLVLMLYKILQVVKITAVGAWAANNLGSSNTYNTAVGNWAMRFCNGGNHNTAVGARALSSAENESNEGTDSGTGECNTAIGSQALRKNDDGNYNTAVGENALSENMEGHCHTAIGNDTGVTNGVNGGVNVTGGNACTFIGRAAGSDSETPENRTAIGAGALVEENNCAVIGNGAINVGIGVNAPSATLEVSGDGNGSGGPTLRVDGDATVTGDATIAGHVISKITKVETMDTTNLTDNDYLILCDTAAATGDINLILPDPSANEGRVLIVVKQTDNDNVTIDSDNLALGSDITISNLGSRTFISDGTNWHVIASV